MPITGSQKALMYAVGGVMRGGASRGGYTSGRLCASVGGVEVGARKPTGAYRLEHLTITDVVDATPNTCAFTLQGYAPTVGMNVVLRLGSVNNAARLFAGVIVDIEQVYIEHPSSPQWKVSSIDFTFLLNQRKVIKRYRNQSVTAIALDLMATYAPSGFTTRNVALGLDVLDEITFTNQDLSEALTNLAKRIGAYWYIDYYKDLHLFAAADTAVTQPTPLTAGHLSLSDFTVARDLTQVVTRVYVEGMGSSSAADLVAGETILPLQSVAMFQSGGGIVASGPQRITYTGRTEVAPGAAPIATPASGSGLASGAFKYAFANVTAAGKTVPSPLASIVLTGVTPAPATAPTAGSPTNGGSIDFGSHEYEVTFVTPSGETTPSPISGSVATSARPTPAAAPSSFALNANPDSYTPVSAALKYTYVFDDGTESLPSPASNVLALDGVHGWTATVPITQPAGVSSRNLYMSVNGGASYTRQMALPFSSGSSITGGASTIFLQSNASPPSVGPTVQTIPLSNVPTGDATVTSRNLWRRFNGTGTFKFVATIANNTTTTYTDTAANASLGAAAPSVNTTTALKVSLSSIIPGPPSTIAREVYRTPVNGSQLQVLTTLGDNVTTTLLDATADAGLGANAPTSDTSGLTSTGFSTTSGATSAGATSLLLASASAFISAGGWAQIGDMTIRYTGKTSTQLTGIPATGPGSILAAVPSGSLVQGLVALTGIPASGPGSIAYAINNGDEVQLVAQVDDVAAQAELAALIGGDGILEDYVQDRNISHAEAVDRGAATLALRSRGETKIRWKSRDHNTHSGGTTSVNLPSPTSVLGDFKIQQVTVSMFGEGISPTFEAEASTTRFSFEQLLQLARKAAA
jgi:hypothetical protein